MDPTFGQFSHCSRSAFTVADSPSAARRFHDRPAIASPDSAAAAALRLLASWHGGAYPNRAGSPDEAEHR
jgi:hypothetical protein